MVLFYLRAEKVLHRSLKYLMVSYRSWVLILLRDKLGLRLLVFFYGNTCCLCTTLSTLFSQLTEPFLVSLFRIMQGNVYTLRAFLLKLLRSLFSSVPPVLALLDLSHIMTFLCTAGLPISYKVGLLHTVVITRSDFKYEAIFGFPSPIYTCECT